MSIRAKERTLVVLLTLFFVWPFVHRALVEHMLVNPWRMFGWAMYCVPDHVPSVRVFAATPEKVGEFIYPTDRYALGLLQDFVNERMQLGRFVKPNLLATLLFQRHPEMSGLMVEVSQPVYDTKTEGFKVVVDRYEFEPSDRTP